MAENIGILVIFFILIIIGMVFYARVQTESVKIESVEKTGQDALITAQRIVNLPEIQCSEPVPTDAGRKDCVDLYKLISFTYAEGGYNPDTLRAELGDKFNTYYYDIFGYSNVTLKQIYPVPLELNLYTNIPQQINRRIPTPVPVLIFDEISDTYSFGLLIVEVYS